MSKATRLLLWTSCVAFVQGWTLSSNDWKTEAGQPSGGGRTSSSSSRPSSFSFLHASTTTTTTAGEEEQEIGTMATITDNNRMFESFVDFLIQKQSAIIAELEQFEQGSATFSRDAWGIFENNNNNETRTKHQVATATATAGNSGGLTRVIQGGNIIEKGACSLTVIRNGVLSAERAATVRARQQDDDINIQEGDTYAAAALSMVLHSRSPHVPTFRSDVRVFSVTTSSGDNSKTLAWFGGGADLTPYYLYDDDITFFHRLYRDLCDEKQQQQEGNDDDDDDDLFSYRRMKKACDDYFYLPARSEHRGTGGIFFDDMEMDNTTMEFVQDVANTWMPSWLPIVEKRKDTAVTDEQRQWQLIRRGRYLEFNLLYDRGVKFGLANANPRVEGVMVSAPPVCAFEYNRKEVPNSPESNLLQILKSPKEWL